MKIICLTVGKKHSTEMASAIAHFKQRLRPYVDFSFDYIQTSDKVTESTKILQRIKPDDLVLLLDERGAPVDNAKLVDVFETAQNNATKRCVIIIGGAYGVDQTVFDRSNHTIALSSLVFPHQLVRLIVVEQLYRSFNTLAGGSYHHE